MASPRILESFGETSTPRVVLIDEADVVEALIAGHLGEDRPLGTVGESGSEEEVVVLNVGKERRGGGRADGGNLPGAGDLTGDGQGGGAGVGADDGVDAYDVHELEDSFEGDFGVAGGVDGEALNGLSEDAVGLV